MEIRDGSQVSVDNVEKARTKTLTKLNSIRDKFRHRESPPLDWGQWKKIILDNRVMGVPKENAPQCFAISNELIDTFGEMLPVKSFGRVDDKTFPQAAKIAKDKLEVVRSFVVDETGNRLLVHIKNGGESKLTEKGSMVAYKKVDRGIGSLHTHPVDSMPSSTDVSHIIRGSSVMEMVVTPLRVIALFRTRQTPYFPNQVTAMGYLDGMNKAKLKSKSVSGVWATRYEDLRDMNILIYEVVRGKNVFVRKG